MPKGNPAINAIAQGIRNRQLANTKKGLVASGKVLKDIRSETAKVNAKMEALIDECDSIHGCITVMHRQRESARVAKIRLKSPICSWKNAHGVMP